MLSLTAAVYLLRPKRDLSDRNFTSVNESSTGVRSIDWRTLRQKSGQQPEEVNVKIPGFMIPLEDGAEDVTEFLLVPYSRSCIHTPTPPRNQIVYVQMAANTHAHADIANPVWVYGTLSPQPDQTAAFRMLSTKIIPLEGDE